MEDELVTNRFRRTSEDGCVQFAEATGKQLGPEHKTSDCRIHTIFWPDQPDEEPVFLGCYHNANLQVDMIVKQPGECFPCIATGS